MKILSFKVIIAVATFALLIFFLFNGLDNVGLEYDELYSVNAALGCPNDKIFLNYVKYRHGFCIPIMLMQYSGAPIALIPAISIHLFGTSVWAFRGFNMVILAVSLILFYVFLSRKFGFKVAALTILFLSLDVQFIFTQHLEKPTLFPFLLRMALLYVLLSPAIRFRVYILGFIAGFSIYTKLDAAFFLLAITIGWTWGLLFNAPRLNTKDVSAIKITNDLLRLCQKTILPFGIAFFLGISPFLKYFQTNYSTVLGVIEVYRKQTAGQTVPLRVDSFFKQLTNSDFYEYVFRENIPLDQAALIGAQLAVFFWLLAAGYLVFNKKYSQLGTAVLAFFVIYLFYPTLAGSHHRLIIYPLSQLVLAIFLVEAAAAFKSRYLKSYFPAVCLGVYLLVFVPVYTKTIDKGRKTCGTVSFNCAIYPLAENLRSEKKTVVLGDWGMSSQVLYLTKGKVPIYEAVFDAWLNTPQELQATLDPYLKNCSAIVLRTPEVAKFQAADQKIRDVLKEEGSYNSILIKDKNQIPQYEVFRSGKCDSTVKPL